MSRTNAVRMVYAASLAIAALGCTSSTKVEDPPLPAAGSGQKAMLPPPPPPPLWSSRSSATQVTPSGAPDPHDLRALGYSNGSQGNPPSFDVLTSSAGGDASLYKGSGSAAGVLGGVLGGIHGGVPGDVLGKDQEAPSARVAHLGEEGESNTEAYTRIDENPFLSVTANALSTFSIDVDRASYSNVRRFINGGQLPPKDAVHIEELINYFTYNYPEPSGGRPFSLTTEVSAAPWNPVHELVRIGLKGKSIETKDLPPTNLVFLVDVSGSMNSPDKLPLLKSAFTLLVDELRPSDRVAIVVYAGSAGLVLPSTTGSEKDKIMDALAALQAGGSTAGGEGIKLAYQVAAENHIDGGNNRVILATDGDFNVGVSSDAEMVRLIEEKRTQGTFLTVLGFGQGNLKDSKMEQMADHGNGHYAYIDSLMEARKVLVSELGGTLMTIAKDVKLQVEWARARTLPVTARSSRVSSSRRGSCSLKSRG